MLLGGQPSIPQEGQQHIDQSSPVPTSQQKNWIKQKINFWSTIKVTKLLIHHQGDHRPALPHLRSPPHPPPHLRADAAPDVRQHSGQLSVKWNLRYICLVWLGLVNFPSGSIWPAAIGNPAQPACGRRSLGRHAPAPAALAPLRTTHSWKNAILEFIGRNGFRKIIFCLNRQNLLQQYLGIQK